jgi:hypothetical protein
MRKLLTPEGTHHLRAGVNRLYIERQNDGCGLVELESAYNVGLSKYIKQGKDRLTRLELWRITQQKPIENQIKRRKWNWIGHTLHKEAGAIEKTTLDWNSQGYRRRGRPKRIWRRTIEDEIRNTGRS